MTVLRDPGDRFVFARYSHIRTHAAMHRRNAKTATLTVWMHSLRIAYLRRSFSSPRRASCTQTHEQHKLARTRRHRQAESVVEAMSQECTLRFEWLRRWSANRKAEQCASTIQQSTRDSVSIHNVLCVVWRWASAGARRFPLPYIAYVPHTFFMGGCLCAYVYVCAQVNMWYRVKLSDCESSE